MLKPMLVFVSLLTTIGSCAQQSGPAVQNPSAKVLKIEMNLSAFGVESDHYPSIKGFIDFEADTGRCEKSYYNPKFNGEVYTFSAAEIKNISELLQRIDFDTLKEEYTVNWSDQPTSTITFYTEKRTYVVEDYGLKGHPALKELYNMIYKI